MLQQPPRGLIARIHVGLDPLPDTRMARATVEMAAWEMAAREEGVRTRSASGSVMAKI